MVEMEVRIDMVNRPKLSETRRKFLRLAGITGMLASTGFSTSVAAKTENDRNELQNQFEQFIKKHGNIVNTYIEKTPGKTFLDRYKLTYLFEDGTKKKAIYKSDYNNRLWVNFHKSSYSIVISSEEREEISKNMARLKKIADEEIRSSVAKKEKTLNR